MVYAASGGAALEAGSIDTRLDAVVTGVMMPGGMSGVELARMLRARRPDLMVILASGYAERLEELKAEGFPVLRNPFRLDELTELLHRAVRERKPGVRAALIIGTTVESTGPE